MEITHAYEIIHCAWPGWAVSASVFSNTWTNQASCRLAGQLSQITAAAPQDKQMLGGEVQCSVHIPIGLEGSDLLKVTSLLSPKHPHVCSFHLTALPYEARDRKEEGLESQISGAHQLQGGNSGFIKETSSSAFPFFPDGLHIPLGFGP